MFQGAVEGRRLQEAARRLDAIGQIVGDVAHAPGAVLAGAPRALPGLCLGHARTQLLGGPTVDPE